MTTRTVWFISALGGLLMVALTLVVFLSVVSRYFFDLPIRATGELSGLLFAWLVFLTAISVTYNDDNIAVTYFRGKLPDSLQKVAELLVKLIMLGFVVVILISSIQLTLAVMNQPLPSLRVSSAWLNSSVALPFVGIMIVLLLQVLLVVARARRGEEEATTSAQEMVDDVQEIE